MSEGGKKYILYVKASCPYCVDAEKLLSERGQQYTVIPFDNQLDALEHMKWAYSHETVPMIFEKDGNNILFIGGYTDLVLHFDE